MKLYKLVINFNNRKGDRKKFQEEFTSTRKQMLDIVRARLQRIRRDGGTFRGIVVTNHYAIKDN